SRISAKGVRASRSVPAETESPLKALVSAHQRASQFPLRPYRRQRCLADQLNRVDFVLAGASCVFGLGYYPSFRENKLEIAAELCVDPALRLGAAGRCWHGAPEGREGLAARLQRPRRERPVEK